MTTSLAFCGNNNGDSNHGLGFPGGLVIKNPPANAGDVCSTLGWEDALEKEMATHSSIFAWEIP